MDTISRYFDILIIVIGLFIVTTIINAKQADRIMEESITVTVTKFTDNVRRQGKLTREAYNSFTKKLDAEGILFNIEMVYTKEIVTPLGENDYLNTEECYYTTELLAGLYNDAANGGAEIDGKADGVVYLNKDDTFTVHVTNRSKTIGEKFSSYLPWFIGSYSTGIDARAGGLVRDETGGD